eukprot:11588782-Alexandrium_andersonii.AAC.1
MVLIAMAMVRSSKRAPKLGPRSSRGAHSAPLFALSANVATRTSPELPRAHFVRSSARGADV